jgi:iron(III) transport system substrate-binding protein
MWFRKVTIAFASAALAWAGVAHAEAPAPYEATQSLIDAAKKEGAIVFYTSTDVEVAQKLAGAFEARYSGLKVQTERNGAERIFQRLGQEYSANIHTADVVETSDAVQFLIFKRNGWLAPALPSDVAQYWPQSARDPDGQYAVFRSTLSIMAYNSKLVKPEDAPKSLADLLDPKWRGKIVKAHPGYSGTIMTGTYAISHALGWDYFQKLGQQKIMQVESSTEPPKKLAQGERPVMADGNEYNVFILKESGVPIEPIYAIEGSPLVPGNAGLFKDAPHPNAARLFYHFMFTQEAQQLISNVGGLRSFHPGVQEKAGRAPLAKIKILQSNAAGIEQEVETIKQKYEQYFGT